MNMHDPFINAISAAEIKAWELDSILVVFDFEDNLELKNSMIDEINHSDFDGVICAVNTPCQLDETITTPLPLVYLNCTNRVDEKNCPCVIIADFLGGYKATQYLIEQGYQDIAMITGEAWSDSTIQRVRGFQQAMTNADYIVNKKWILAGNWSIKESYCQTKKLLSGKKIPTAIFCASDLMALGVYQAIAEKGLTIPDDIAVISYDNQLLANEITPSLTSIDLPYDDMARMAVDIILSPNPPELKLIKIEGELIIRDSVRSL